MFTQLMLKHFKAWRERIEIPLAPVTILLGTNSSGKSSLLQALLLLKQTALSPDRSIHLNFGGDDASAYFNFGGFEDVLTKDVVPQQFEIGFSFKPWTGIGFSLKRITIALHNPSSSYVEGVFFANYGIDSLGSAVIQNLEIQGREIQPDKIMRDGVGLHQYYTWKPQSGSFRAICCGEGVYSIFVNDETEPRGTGNEYAPERSIALPSEAIQLLARDGAWAEDLSLAIRRELTTIAYLGPLRRKPERDYVWNKTKPGELGTDGAGFVNALFDSALHGSKSRDPNEIVKEVSSWLARLGVAERLEARQVGRSSHYEIVVHKDGVVANLRDVGIGISQVLPVLTLAFFAPEGSTVLLEEPEIHLHPLAQSVLAELFVEVSRKRRVQFIVETHSEHLFRRLQTLVAKETLSLEDCRMYFVERRGADAVLKNLELDKYGRVTQWPDKFFGDALGETSELARLMFERQKRERQA